MKALAFGLLLAVLATGCEDPCLVICEDRKTCPEDATDPNTDCAEQCAALRSDEAACSAELEELLTCIAGDNVCTPDPSSCAEAYAAYEACP